MSDLLLGRIVDLTLRDGEQAAGIAFPRERRVDIARAVYDVGIHDLEAGIPAMGKDAEEDFLALAKALPQARLIAWNRCSVADVEASARAGASTVHVSVPVSEILLEKKLGWNLQRALDELGSVLAYSSRLGLETIVGAEDASRADIPALLSLYDAAVKGGAIRLRYADTLGVEEPFIVREVIQTLVRRFSVPIEYHAHNDLGLATANAISAMKAGAMASVTVLGMGERAGNASLEQVACASKLLFDLDSGVDLGALSALADLVSGLSGQPIPRDKPLVGSGVFSHESGIHVDGLLKSPQTYEFVRPALVGRRRSVVPGRHSGKRALRYCAQVLGYELEDDEVARLASIVRERWEYGAPSDPWRFLSLILWQEFRHAK
jgi:homocitrate synthase NifV